MTLGYFIIAGLDLLGALHPPSSAESSKGSISASERQGYVNWIYHCQLPSGGFRGFPGTDFGADKRNADNEVWDPANLPATFFALVTLLMLGDDLVRVRRMQCLRWLTRMQREDGSFGEVLGAEGKIEGGNDLRFCCCAAGIRYILRGRDEEFLKRVEDIDTQRLIEYVENCQVRSMRSCSCSIDRRVDCFCYKTYDGGFAQAPWLEAHGMNFHSSPDFKIPASDFI